MIQYLYEKKYAAHGTSLKSRDRSDLVTRLLFNAVPSVPAAAHRTRKRMRNTPRRLVEVCK